MHPMPGGACFAEMRTLRANVSDFDDPLLRKFALQAEVPLLRARDLKVVRNFEDKQVLGGVRAGASATTVDASLSGVIVSETG